MKTKLLLTGLALVALTTLAGAQNQGNGIGRFNGKGRGTAYVDNNKNGICDNRENGTANFKGKKVNGFGICDGTGKGRRTGKGRYFTDANKDGVCDNFKNRIKK